MARYSASALAAGAGSATLPIGSLYASASVTPQLRQIAIFNTTAVSVTLQLVRLTTAGTQGAAITASKYNDRAAAATGTPVNTHTVAPTLGNVLGSYVLGAAVGAAVMDVFGDTGLLIPAGVANGIGIIPVGTGQICYVTFVWDE